MLVVVVSVVGVAAWAADGRRSVDVMFRNIQIHVDGQAISMDTEPFIVVESGRTMIPDRALAEALGARVSWDSDRAVVSVDSALTRSEEYLSSGAAKLGRAGWAAYAASKAGLHAFAEAVADEARPAGVGVHLIVPGAVATGFWTGAKRPEHALDPDDVAAVTVAALNLPTQAQVEEIRIRPRRAPRFG